MPDETLTPNSPAWDDQLLVDPHGVADKQSRVQRMFAAIAGSYDFNNRLHSLGQDQRWRKRAVKLAMLKPTDGVVDVACGTGDLTYAFLNAFHDIDFTALDLEYDDQIIGIDYTFEMLPIARQKRKGRYTLNGPAFLNGDAQSLPLPDACADVVSIAFGIRNVADPAQALREFRRILRPGGRVIILEFSKPKSRVIRWLNDLYCAHIMPHTATWISGDRSGAYKYLPMSVKSFMNREEMMRQMRDAGFENVEQFPMTFGVCVVYRGFVVKDA